MPLEATKVNQNSNDETLLDLTHISTNFLSVTKSFLSRFQHKLRSWLISKTNLKSNSHLENIILL